MNKFTCILLILLLSGCVQISTTVSMAGADGKWFLYVNEPTMDFEFSKHGPGFGNIPERYRVKLPVHEGEFDALSLTITKLTADGYRESIELTNGKLTVEKCVATINLFNKNGALSFNGVYDIPKISCAET